jgi:hypothetical protein
MGDGMPKRTFKLKLRLKDCEKVFAEGFEPGVVVEQEISFNLPDDYNADLFAMQMLRQEGKFIERHVEVLVEEIEG